MRNYLLVRVHLDTHAKLKELSAARGQTIAGLIDMLVNDAMPRSRKLFLAESYAKTFHNVSAFALTRERIADRYMDGVSLIEELLANKRIEPEWVMDTVNQETGQTVGGGPV